MSRPEQMSVRERNGVWHVCIGTGDSWFQPILCSELEGINAPGPRVQREPTCPVCITILNEEWPDDEEPLTFLKLNLLNYRDGGLMRRR